MPTQVIPVRAGDHVVQFYQRDSELAATVGSLLARGVGAGGAAIVIATGPHRQAFESALAAAGIDVREALHHGRLISLDAAATLARFMPSDEIDTEAFREVIGGVVREAGRYGRPVHAYGEMVALLWDAGNAGEAIRLEELWNELGRDHRFSLLCGYHSSPTSGPKEEKALQHVRHLHSRVLDAQHGDSQRPVQDELAPVEVFRQFHAGADAPSAARRFVANALSEWEHDGALLSDAELVLSELVTNSVIHAGSPVSISVSPASQRVRLSVHDPSPVEPSLRFPGSLEPGGRGMHVIAATASRWGVESTGEGKIVWAELGSSAQP
jgi:anti-sigma regulatory factor (Ser/Thr protein kinase)